MENKIGEIESNVSYEEYKLGVKCRYKHGDKCILIIAIIYVLSSIIIKVVAPILDSWGTLFLIIVEYKCLYLFRLITQAFIILQPYIPF